MTKWKVPLYRVFVDKNDLTIWEKEPLEKLVEINQLSAYQHHGFYQHMDTMKEKEFLNEMNKRSVKYGR